MPEVKVVGALAVILPRPRTFVHDILEDGREALFSRVECESGIAAARNRWQEGLLPFLPVPPLPIG